MKDDLPEIVEGWAEEYFTDDALNDDDIKNVYPDFTCLSCAGEIYDYDEDIKDEIVELFASLSCLAYQVHDLKKYIHKDSEYFKYFHHEFWDMFKR